ncbi:DNA polymerase III subunit beta [Vibrio pomeroyi]|uniref:Beta sliding clamp n=1 Tax=Vibrio pomeroyi TaxID=198832 RepID=A0ABV4MRI7_9VIBR|nr:DNA polymerase III subunit beta [Vibrio atlanticus]MCZ4310200.1 DNA polymerase III subunit beta [Vibrio atlanticus]
MELIANNSQSLISFIGHACSNADSRQTGIQSFEFVSIVSKGGQLEITGSNGNQSFTRICEIADVQAKGDGQLCVDAEKLSQVVRALPKNTPVKLKAVKGKDRALISCGRSRLQLKTIDSKEYPTVDMLDDTAINFNLPAKEFVSLLNDVIYAAGRNDVRNFLNGIYLNVAKNYLYASASDGHRMTASKIQIDKDVAKMGILLPIRSMEVFTRLSEAAETIKVSFSESRAEFNWGGLVYRTALIDAKYPDITRLIPTKCESQIKVNRAEFVEVLKRLMVMVSGERSQKVKISTSDNQIQLHTIIENEEDGLGEDFVSAEVGGSKIDYEYGVNPKYLLDALNHMYTDEVSMGFTGANESCCLSPVGAVTSKALIMPVRL